MAKKKDDFKPHRILREIYRHYNEFEDLFRLNGTHVIDHAVLVDGVKTPITISLFDLREGISETGPLSPRKRQAVMLNVIKDLKQKDVAEIMKITTVSVGQYVENAMEQLAPAYFPELYDESSAVRGGS
jgi:hypothetical protein